MPWALRLVDAAPLAPGWTFVPFTGGDGTTLESLLANHEWAVTRAFRFDSPSQVWQSFTPGGLAFLNQFTTVDKLTGLLIRSEAPEDRSLVFFEGP